jgi:hypothetical protein
LSLEHQGFGLSNSSEAFLGQTAHLIAHLAGVDKKIFLIILYITDKKANQMDE